MDLITNGRLDPGRVVNIPTDADQVLQTAKLMDDMLENLLDYIDKVLVRPKSIKFKLKRALCRRRPPPSSPHGCGKLCLVKTEYGRVSVC